MSQIDYNSRKGNLEQMIVLLRKLVTFLSEAVVHIRPFDFDLTCMFQYEQSTPPWA